MLVERGPQRADAPVHHVARRHRVGPGLGLRDRGARQQLERGVVVDHAVGAQHAAVTVARVLAQADVGEHEQLGVRRLDRARGELDHALVVPGARALLVLLGRQAEQQHARDPERGGGARLVDRAVDRQVVDPRQRRDRRPPLSAGDHEHRVDQVLDRQLGLAHEPAQEAGAAKSSESGRREHQHDYRVSPAARRKPHPAIVVRRYGLSRTGAARAGPPRRTRRSAPAGGRAAAAGRRR